MFFIFLFLLSMQVSTCTGAQADTCIGMRNVGQARYLLIQVMKKPLNTIVQSKEALAVAITNAPTLEAPSL